MLEMLDLSDKDFHADVEKSMRVRKLIEQVNPLPTDVSADEISAFYKANPEKFQAPERVRASHILLVTAPTDGEDVKEQKRRKLEGIKAEIDTGADFAELARKHSNCPSAQRGGDLGYFSRNQMVKPFEEAAFGLEPGTVSDIVETRFGFHLIKTIDRQEASLTPLEQAQDKIKAFLLGQKHQEMTNQYVAKLLKTAKIEFEEGFAP
jgi:peptidyl-prolyl cis-trans isomerase C